MRCKNAFSPSADDPGIQCSQGLTEQHHKDRVDINNIMDRYTITGMLPDVRESLGVYGDFSDVGDFMECQLKIKEAEEAFMGLPAVVRKRFDNQPAKLLEFLHDPENRAEAERLGIIESKPITPVKVSEPVGDTANSKTN